MLWQSCLAGFFPVNHVVAYHLSFTERSIFFLGFAALPSKHFVSDQQEDSVCEQAPAQEAERAAAGPARLWLRPLFLCSPAPALSPPAVLVHRWRHSGTGSYGVFLI